MDDLRTTMKIFSLRECHAEENSSCIKMTPFCIYLDDDDVVWFVSFRFLIYRPAEGQKLTISNDNSSDQSFHNTASNHKFTLLTEILVFILLGDIFKVGGRRFCLF